MRAIRFNFVLLLTCICISVSSAHADIVSVENFDGTSWNTDIWEAFRSQYISQDDALSFAASANGGDLTTRTQTVGVGESVRALVSVETGSASLFLTNDSGGLTDPTSWDTAFLEVALSSSNDSVRGGFGGTGRTTDVIFAEGIDLIGTNYILEIARVSSEEVNMSAYAEDGTFIDSTELWVNGIPDDLFISLGSTGRATFDQVQVLTIPEPATGLLLAPALFLILRARRIH